MDFSKSLQMQSVENARQLGGYINQNNQTIVQNRLLRTGHLNKLNEQDTQKLVDTYHVHTIVDFRSSVERKNQPDIEIEGVNYVWIPIIPEMEVAGNVVTHSNDGVDNAIRMMQNDFEMNAFYINLIENDMAKKGYRKFFDLVLALPDNASILWHCTAGKDRTGLAAFFLMTVLDVDHQTCMDDYMSTNDYQHEKIEKMVALVKERLGNNDLEIQTRSFYGTVDSIMQSCADYCNRTYGSVRQFIIQEIGVSEEEIQQLQSAFLID